MRLFRYTSLMSPNPKSTFSPPPNPSLSESAEWFYNEIMRHIEPDLLSTVILTHAEKYKSETQEQREARIKSYDNAFIVFDRVADDYGKQMASEVQEFKKQERTKAMKKEKKQEKKALKKIEGEMEQS